MLIYVRCPSCGEPIGAVYEAFHAIRTHLIREELKKLPDVDLSMVAVEDVVKLDMDDVFEKLGIPKSRWCCRMRLNTNVNMHDM